MLVVAHFKQMFFYLFILSCQYLSQNIIKNFITANSFNFIIISS